MRIIKHQYEVTIYWLEHPKEFKNVLATSEFYAKEKVIQGSNKGMYDAEKSKAKLIKHNVAVQHI